MRAFVALALPEAAAARLAVIGARCPGARPVPEENLHLTLAFLDEVGDAALEEMHDRLLAIRALAPELRIEGIGTFGSRAPRNLHAAVRPDPRLDALVRAVRGAARQAGIVLPHRRFVPHVTLARFPKAMVAEPEGFARFAADHARLSMEPLRVHAFGLYRSDLFRDGARYTELATYPLTG